jgi:lactoylglutathione lyase
MNDDCLVKDLSFRVHHTMLPVADLDRSVAFYTRLLGMKVQDRHASEARKVEVGLVGYGENAGAPFLELIKDTSENAPARVTPANIHVGIDTSDLRKLCAILGGLRSPLVNRGPTDGPERLSATRRHELEPAERTHT